MKLPRLEFAFLRQRIVGVDSTIETPFGERLMVYCDYTASGRSLDFIEHYLMRIQRRYANTHTEDDVTGRSMSHLLHEAEAVIKNALNAGPGGRIIACGAGCTAAIDKFQQIVGVQLPPVTRRLVLEILGGEDGLGTREEIESRLLDRQPVIFVGPYEHHSNEVTWRQGLATVVEVSLAADGGIDLAHLESLLQDPRYKDRLRVGSFSAASNVTGIRSPVHELARLLHKHGALACFDYAACAPYDQIDMNPPAVDGEDASLDAVFISPHKFLGGPGSSGVLVFNERVYAGELPPSVAGGGTVSYVSPESHDFVADIEEREKAGTPGVLQTMKAAMVFLVKQAAGIERIEQREHTLLGRALEQWSANPGIELLGQPDPERHIAILSFNVKTPAGGYLHPRFVTVLLNDLFGIQSRAGCSCAGPYGHTLLGIDRETSERYRHWICEGFQGIKPGWCRVGFHYVMDDPEADYLIDAVDFVARRGHLFLPLYHFDLNSASWTHHEDPGGREGFSLEDALASGCPRNTALGEELRARLYRDYICEAHAMADELERQGPPEKRRLEGEMGELQFFEIPQ